MGIQIRVSPHKILDTDKTFYDVQKLFMESSDILFIMSGNNLKGIITRGDYDKACSQSIDYNTNVTEICNTRFAYLKEGEEYREHEIFKQKSIRRLPIIEKDGRPKAVLVKCESDGEPHFYCRVLSGLSNYYFSVNADMTVSCHCHLRGKGYLGNLREQTLKSIYESEYVSNLRQEIYNACLPTECCMCCSELILAPKSIAKYYLTHYKVPNGIMVENTSICNLKCINCFNEYIEKTTLSLEDTERIATELAENEIGHVDMFKYGEPFADNQILEKIDIIKNNCPSIKTISVSSNGMLINTPEKIQAAMELTQLIISFDGVNDEMLNKFQRGSSFKTVTDNIRGLLKRRKEERKKTPEITWKVVLFPWNDGDDIIDDIFEKAKGVGFDSVIFVTGGNLSESSNAIWESEVFEKYMQLYKCRYTDDGGGTFYYDLR